MSNLAKITPIFSINSFMGFFSGLFEYKVHMSSISWNMYVFDQFNEYLLNKSVIVISF